MDFERSNSLFSAPVPSDDLLTDDGHVRLESFANPEQVEFVDAMVGMILKDARGFSTAASIYLPLTGEPNPEGLADGVFLVDVDPKSPGFLSKHPIDVSFMADGGPFAAPNLLVALPVQGQPLRASTTYALIVLRALGDRSGAPLGVSLSMAQLAAGQKPVHMSQLAFTRYDSALRTLSETLDIRAETLAGMSVFTTDDPTRALSRVREVALREHMPQLNAPFALALSFDDYCVYETTVDIPVFQAGTPPYFSSGGDWQLDDSGAPLLQMRARSNLIVTVPRQPMPAAGYPAVAYIRQGGSGKWPLVERSARLPPSNEDVLGAGPAREFAKVGFAGVSLDGPHGGLRNPNNQDEQILIFNLFNPVAMRDNIRQSALEISLLASIIETLQVDTSACGGGQAKFDMNLLTLFGHSTGAWIAPIAAAFEPRFKALLLSGAGSSWIMNIVHKKSPLDVKVVANDIVGYNRIGRTISETDPTAFLAQWAADSADPQNYASRVIDDPPLAPRHVLMMQGVVDTYIPAPVASGTILSLGLDFAGTPIEPTIAPLLSRVARNVITLPAGGNRNDVTAVVVQHAKDAYEDGHEVVFQREEPKYQYRCFLKHFAAGETPIVAAGIADTGVCP